MFGIPIASYFSADNRLVALIMGLLVITSPVWSYALLFPTGYGYSAGLLGVPALVMINAFLIARFSRDDWVLSRLLYVAFLAKLASASIYLFLIMHVMDGGDALGYHRFGSQIASDFVVTGDWASFTVSREGYGGPTLLVCDLVGFLYLITGSSISIGVVVFSTVGFWGQYLAYKAFTIAFPDGERSRAALLLLLFPSLVFWTSAIGKDAIIGFSICLTAYGFARLVRTPGIRAYFYLAIGLIATYFIRPHVAAILALALTGAYVFGSNLRGFLGVAIKIATVPLLGYGSIWLIQGAQQFLKAETFSKALVAADTITRNTNLGNSAMGALNSSLLARIATAPFLLFRPFPWEINNLQAAVAAAETLFLLWMFWIFRTQLKAAGKRWRSHPFLLFILFYSFEFSVTLAGTFSNIGLIARQRVMMLPFVLMLFCWTPDLPIWDAPRLSPVSRLEDGLGWLRRNRQIARR